MRKERKNTEFGVILGKRGQTYALIWEPRNYQSKPCFNALLDAPRFITLTEDEVAPYQKIENIYGKLRLVSFTLVNTFITYDSKQYPTHYDLFPPGENAEYDEWIYEYHKIPNPSKFEESQKINSKRAMKKPKK